MTTLSCVLGKFITAGKLTVVGPNGRAETLGSGTPQITVRLHDWRGLVRLALNPELALGELYMDGRLTIEQGDIVSLVELLMANQAVHGVGGLLRVHRVARQLVRRLSQFNPLIRARSHVAHHYDLSPQLYAKFLDADWQYSCGYFPHPRQSLDDAQTAKKRHVEAKLVLDRPGLRILDIGSGWGGLAIDIAQHANASVTGITLSKEQVVLARERAARAGVGDICTFRLSDYREVSGQFDRIVSVGMFEHVGVGYYDEYFRKCRDLLGDDGVMLLHTIGRSDGPGATNAWISKYIFPGGYAPALSEILVSIEKSGLIVTDVEVLRLHYAETLKRWQRRFRKHRQEIASLYDERFCRMWEFYLAGSEMAFRYSRHVVFQIQLAKKMDSLPITRDYMTDSQRPVIQASSSRGQRYAQVG